MNIAVRSYLAGSFLLEQEPGRWDTLVVLDSDVAHTDFVAQHSPQHLYLRFDDIDKTVAGKRKATVDHVRSALEFAEQAEHLLICCRAGQRRSAALAFIACFHRLGADEAYNLLNPTRHFPNPLIIELGARLIHEREYLPTYQRWRAAHQHISLFDQLDDIEAEIEMLKRAGARELMIDE